MANRLYKQFQGTLEAGVVKLYGQVTTSTSGTIASQNSKGFTVTKVGATAGRYLVTLADKYQGLLAAKVALQGGASAAYTTAKGLNVLLRSVSVSAASPVLTVQFVRTDTAADAEVEDGAIFYIELSLKNSSAY